MVFAVQQIRLDVSKPGSQGVIYARKNDTASRKISASLYMGAAPYIPGEGCRAVFRALKPDGTYIFNDAELESNCVQIALTTQTLAAVGRLCCEADIYGANNELLHSPQFEVVVEDVIYSDSEIESTNEFSALTGALSQVTGFETQWSNPTIAVTAGDEPDAAVEFMPGEVAFSFVLPRGIPGEPGPVGPAGGVGPIGPQGETGAPGEAATVRIGTVTTGAPGTAASVVNSGTTSDAVLDFVIPRGMPGGGGGSGDMGIYDIDANGVVDDSERLGGQPPSYYAAAADLEAYVRTEEDPTVPDWAKADEKPSYTASEVGADPAGSSAAVQINLNNHSGDTEIHHTHANKATLDSISDENIASWDSKAGANHASNHGIDGSDPISPESIGALSVESDPTVPAWAKTAEKPSYTASEVGAATAAQGALAETAIQPSGGELTGVLVASNPAVAVRGIRNIIIFSEEPTADQLQEGDLFFVIAEV